MPVDTKPKNKIAKYISISKSKENALGSRKNNGIENIKPEIIVAEAKADDLM